MRSALAILLSIPARHSLFVHASPSPFASHGVSPLDIQFSASIAFAGTRKRMTTRRRSSRTKASATAKPDTQPAPKSRQYTRPGVEAAARLVSLRPMSDHVDKWERASSHYAAMIKAKGGAKLVDLDERREEIARGWTAKLTSPGTMTKDQLLSVVIEWKFSKGKPRHALKPLLRSNSDASVSSAAKRAFEAADGIPDGDAGGECDGRKSALNRLCELKGVGPATASAILCLYRPDIFAFMDDEVIECLHDGKRGYTLKIYMGVNDQCREIAAELNEATKIDKDGSSEWTPCKVGKALWTLATMSATNDEEGLSAIFDDGGAGTIQGRGTNGENKKSLNSRKKAKKS